MPSRILLSLGRRLPIAAAAAVLLLVWPLFAADGVEVSLRETHWGEASDSLLHQFGAAVEQLPRPLDFGDSYADIVLRGNTFGGVPMVVFFQMDKATHGLKRLQLEPSAQPARFPRGSRRAARRIRQ